MITIRNLLRTGFIAWLVVLIAGVMPIPATALDSAIDTGSAPATTQQPVVPTNGTTGPTGAAAWTYHRNETTGLWENDYYIYDPVTKETTPKVAIEYTYNSATGLWDTQVWQYNAAAGNYALTTVSVTAPPAGAITHGGPAASESAQPAAGSQELVSGAVPQTPATAAIQTAPSGQTAGQENTAAAAAGMVTPTLGSSGTLAGTALTLTNSGAISNLIDSSAQSGTAAAIANTTAGNVASGTATSMAIIINLLQSQSSLGGSGTATFTANIQGNVQGDFLIDPANYIQPASSGSPQLSNFQVNSRNDGQIANTINLDATSGAADAERNTTVGNVTSGDANAIANVINMINSVVAANQSFIGIINIYGDYTGNILMPTNSLNALLASAGPNQVPSTAVVTDVNNTSTQNIQNNINLSAVSGNAAASENTIAGNVSSGDGLTNLTLLNLTGRRVVAANSLLVFVNVLGNWVGLIMDAPSGTTSAALGGDVDTDTSAALPATTNVANSDTSAITNAITANARSGGATASQNTTVGDVRSGNATASANVANILGSQLSLSNWFGVLFINVFGTWHGNFGTVEPPASPIGAVGGMGGGSRGSLEAGAGGAPTITDMRVFAFAPRAGGNGGGSGLQLSPGSLAPQSGSMSSGELVSRVSKVLASATKKNTEPNTITTTTSTPTPDFAWSRLLMALGLAGFGFVGIDRVRSHLRNRRRWVVTR